VLGRREAAERDAGGILFLLQELLLGEGSQSR